MGNSKNVQIKLDVETKDALMALKEIRDYFKRVEQSNTQTVETEERKQAKIRKDSEKNIKNHFAQLYQIEQNNAKLRSRTRRTELAQRKEMNSALSGQATNLKGVGSATRGLNKDLEKQIKLTTRLGQLSMSTYAVSRFVGWGKDFSEMLTDQEKMNTQMALLENKQAGWNEQLIVAQKETKGLLKQHELLTAAMLSNSMNIGLKPDEFTDLARQANKIALTLGENFEISFNKLMRGISRGSIKLLDDLIPGIKSLESMYADYAQEIGKSTNELTEQEKLYARKVEVLRAIKGLNKDINQDIIDQNTKLTQQVNRLDIWWNSVKKTTTQGILDAAEFYGLLDSNLDDTIAKNKLLNAEYNKLIQIIRDNKGSVSYTSLIGMDATQEMWEKEYAKVDAFAKYMKDHLGSSFREYDKKRIQELRTMLQNYKNAFEKYGANDLFTQQYKMRFDTLKNSFYEYAKAGGDLNLVLKTADNIAKERRLEQQRHLELQEKKQAEIDNMINQALKAEMELRADLNYEWNTAIDSANEKIQEMIDKIKGEDYEMGVNLQFYLDGKVATSEAIADWQRKHGIIYLGQQTGDDETQMEGRRGFGALGKQTFKRHEKKEPCPIGKHRDPYTGKCVMNRKSYKKKEKPLNYEEFIKAYAMNVYGFDPATISNKTDEEFWLKIRKEAMGGATANEAWKKDRKIVSIDPNKQIKQFKDMAKTQEDIDKATKAHQHSTLINENAIKEAREAQIQAQEIANEKLEVEKQNVERLNKNWKEQLDIYNELQARREKGKDKSFVTDADKQIALMELEIMYNQRQAEIKNYDLKLALLRDYQIQKEKLLNTETLQQINFGKMQEKLWKNTINILKNATEELGNVAWEGMFRGIQADRARKELQMQMDNINGDTQEGLEKRQELLDAYNHRKAYEDKVWLDRAIGNALIEAGSQIWSDGIKNLWQGGGKLFDPATATAGALQMAYGGAELLAGAGLGYAGEAMLPPEYQGMPEDSGAKDRNEMQNCDKTQPVITYAFPSQRNFINTVQQAVQGIRS